LADAVEKVLRVSPNSDSADSEVHEAAMMGRRRDDQASLFYESWLDDRVPKEHLLRRIDVFVTAALAHIHEQLAGYYSDIGRPSVNSDLMIRMPSLGTATDYVLNAG
jgi:hypothetical protein